MDITFTQYLGLMYFYLLTLDSKVEYGVKDEIIMFAGGDILPCYKYVGATQKEVSRHIRYITKVAKIRDTLKF